VNTDLTNPQRYAGQTQQTAETPLQRAAKVAAAVDAVYEQPTSYNNPDLPSWHDGTRIGTAPPVDQPGRPSMSRTATNISGVMIASSAPIFALGAAATGILWGSGQADPTVIGWICAGAVALPVALAAPVLALKGLMKSAKQVAEAAPPVIHQHYTGTVHQDRREVHSNTRGIIANTRNQLPR
jgi:hypothetical protein